MNKRILVTGGSGYKGHVLVPKLLEKGYKVTVFDILFFGKKFLPKENSNFKIIEGDLRDYEKLKKNCENHDTFVHLACISNDASFVLDENLSTSINERLFL